MTGSYQGGVAYSTNLHEYQRPSHCTFGIHANIPKRILISLYEMELCCLLRRAKVILQLRLQILVIFPRKAWTYVWGISLGDRHYLYFHFPAFPSAHCEFGHESSVSGLLHEFQQALEMFTTRVSNVEAGAFCVACPVKALGSYQIKAISNVRTYDVLTHGIAKHIRIDSAFQCRCRSPMA